MIEFWIADLKSAEKIITVPCALGAWEFHQRDDYANVMKGFEDGQCVPSYFAFNSAIGRTTPDDDFEKAIGQLIDICLILSFVTGACVTPKGTTAQSDIQFLDLGDSFIRPRAIRGFDPLNHGKNLNDFLSLGLSQLTREFQQRRMRLFLSHWISGLTCFSLEDLFLTVGVQMDIVKQCEISVTGAKKRYFEGMESASSRFGIAQLSTDYKNMRNDIVHEGRLSGSNFRGRSKSDCATVTADALNWIDNYVWAVLTKPYALAGARWKSHHIEYGLPALSLHV